MLTLISSWWYIHLAYIVILILALRSWRAWRVEEKYERMNAQEEDEEEASAIFPRTNAITSAASSRSSLTPWLHAHQRLSQFLHILAILAATYACTRLADTASRELQLVGITKFIDSSSSSTSSSSLPSTASSLDGTLRHPRDAELLIPKQRGGKLTVQQIMEQDVAHIVKKQQVKENRAEANAAAADPASKRAAAKSLPPITSVTAAPALLFHILSLPLSLAHLLLYSPWSHIDPRLAISVSKRFYIRPRLQSLFQATSMVAVLMQVVLALALYAMLGTDTTRSKSDLEMKISSMQNPPTPTSQFGELTSDGLVTGLLYLPYFLYHTLRFCMQMIFHWNFSVIFPQIGTSPEKVQKRNERMARKKAKGKNSAREAALARRKEIVDKQNATSTTSASSATSSSSSSSSSSIVSSPPASTITHPSTDDPDSDFEEGFDMVMLNELAAFAPPDSSSSMSADGEISLESLEPSPLIQKLRNTPKVQEEYQKQREAKKSAGKKRN